MIISGDFIALSKGTDFVSTLDKEEHGPDLPEVIWFNIRNIVALSCYNNSYRLCLDEEHNITIESSAANELIALMRKERDDKANERLNRIKKLNDELRTYGYRITFNKYKAVIKEIKEDE